HRLFKGREFDHDEAMKLLRALHDLMAPPARQHLAAVSGENVRNQIGIFLVFNRIVDLCARHPIGRHGGFPPTRTRNALAFCDSPQYETNVQGERWWTDAALWSAPPRCWRPAQLPRRRPIQPARSRSSARSRPVARRRWSPAPSPPPWSP